MQRKADIYNDLSGLVTPPHTGGACARGPLRACRTVSSFSSDYPIHHAAALDEGFWAVKIEFKPEVRGEAFLEEQAEAAGSYESQ